MNILTQNWIKFFHNAQFQSEIMQKAFNFISELSSGTSITIESIARHMSVSSNLAIDIIKSMIESKLLTLDLRCPYCNEQIEITDKQILVCKYCENEIELFSLSIAVINSEASLGYLFKDKIYENSYETNAKILSEIGKKNGCLYYLLTDIENSQTLQRTDPNQYSLILDQLWSDMWPKIIHIARKASLPLMARGDEVSCIFADKEDILNTIEELILFLSNKPVIKLTIYGSDIFISSRIKDPFVRNIDKKWDLNTPSLTDLYRKKEFKPAIWNNTNNYIVKYCLFDELANISINNSLSFLGNGILTDYYAEDKHNNHYKGKCYAGYCDAKIIEIGQESLYE